MVSVRQSHQKNNQFADFSDWIANLDFSDDARLEAVTRCHHYLFKINNDPLIMSISRELVEILNTLNMDAETLTAAMLYPYWQRKLIDQTQITEFASNTVFLLVNGIEQMAAIRFLHKQRSDLPSEQIDNIRRMLLAMVEDVRAVVIKLAVCIIELRLAKNADEETRVLAAKEASTLYAPLANRLGIGQLKWEIEDYCFRYQHPETYQRIASMLDEKRKDRASYIKNFVSQVQAQLSAMEIEGEVFGRPKHIYSIWKKMQKKGLNFERLFDIRAIRILVHSVKDCYAVMGAIHVKWRPISKEFDDYISAPKPNGYQSIHTVLIGPEGKAVEVQIRTHQMHEDSELGVAAHWRYKEGTANGKEDSYQEKINWLRKLLQWQEDVNDDSNMLEELRSQVFEDRVYVFTPKGDVVDLPQGSTPLDFAYYIHSNVGHRCIGAKVSGRIVPFSYELQNGDQLEILTSKSPNPKRDWLNASLGYIKSSRARAKIHHWFKQQDKDKNLEEGRDVLERELKRSGLTLQDAQPAISRFNMHSFDDLLAAVGAGDIGSNQVINFIQSQQQKSKAEDDQRLLEKLEQPANNKKLVGNASGIVVQGVGNLLTYMAKCCQPVKGDAVTGYITHGKGVSIHRSDCDQLAQMLDQHPERQVDVDWGDADSKGSRVTVRVIATDRAGLLRDITTILANDKAYVLGVQSHSDEAKQEAAIDIDMSVPHLDSLTKVLSKLSQLPDIYEAKRLH
ncbi:GTP diphosphokinase [Catenovulum adriaticum]|uniref:GTP pyrophosphokinase n=1 Tax=Catenovulum adriaticum TaxID=2984846 RepID=A0ABY7ALL2_9ALTE|nr:GTP diphosphokinase [Catenovulum sp. TS8]WAJ69556.1 GTP diphosphokinase [Catenovulum sp. TS8]